MSKKRLFRYFVSYTAYSKEDLPDQEDLLPELRQTKTNEWQGWSVIEVSYRMVDEGSIFQVQEFLKSQLAKEAVKSASVVIRGFQFLSQVER